jgi:hypothetical protein
MPLLPGAGPATIRPATSGGVCAREVLAPALPALRVAAGPMGGHGPPAGPSVAGPPERIGSRENRSGGRRDFCRRAQPDLSGATCVPAPGPRRRAGRARCIRCAPVHLGPPCAHRPGRGGRQRVTTGERHSDHPIIRARVPASCGGTGAGSAGQGPPRGRALGPNPPSRVLGPGRHTGPGPVPIRPVRVRAQGRPGRPGEGRDSESELRVGSEVPKEMQRHDVATTRTKASVSAPVQV